MGKSPLTPTQKRQAEFLARAIQEEAEGVRTDYNVACRTCCKSRKYHDAVSVLEFVIFHAGHETAITRVKWYAD